MADNFTVTEGTGTTIRAVEKSSKKTQVVTIDLGGSGAETLPSGTIPVSGNVTADTELPSASSLSDGTSNPSTSTIAAMNELYNGTTWDRQRGNHEITVFDSQARAANATSSDFINYNNRGIIITFDITALNSTNLNLLVKYKDTLGGKYFTLLQSTAISSVSATAFTIYPGVTVAANIAVSTPLPRIWRVEVTRGGTPGTDTYSISANYIV